MEIYHSKYTKAKNCLLEKIACADDCTSYKDELETLKGIKQDIKDRCICFDKDVKQVIMRNYYSWYEAHLFGDSGKYIAKKDKSSFGTKVFNQITREMDILLYTYKNPCRTYQDYAMCINRDAKIYYIGLQYIN